MRRHSNCAKRQRNHQRRQEKCCCQRGRPTAPAGAAPAEPRAVRAVPGRSGCPPCSPAHLRPTSAGWSLWAGAGRWSADRQVQQMARGSAPTGRAAGRSAATRIRARHRPGGRAHGAATAPGERRLLSWPPECPPRCAGWVGGRRGQGCSSAGGNLGSEAGAPPGFPSWRSELWVERAPMTPGRPLSTPAELGGRQHWRSERPRSSICDGPRTQ